MTRSGLIIALVLASGCEPIPPRYPSASGFPRSGVSAAMSATERCRRLFEDGNYQNAELACAEALRMDSAYISAWRIYLPTLIAEHKEDKAIAEAERAEDKVGIISDATVFAFHGAAILSAAGRPAVDPVTNQPNNWAKEHARALQFLERAVALDSEQYVAQSLLCTDWMLDRGYQGRSQAACLTALRRQPNNVELLISLAWIRHNFKRHADAQKIGEQVQRLNPRPQDKIKAKLVIGLSQAALGDCVNARRTLEPIYEIVAKRAERNEPAVAMIQRGLYVCPPHDAK
jgi:tetratricopeptide (TPR) repeat protein